jgi:hypothetical protein
MIQIQDGPAQKLAELVVVLDQLNNLENAQQKNGYSGQRSEMIRERKKKVKDLTDFLYPWATETHHALIKVYPTPKMIEIGGLVHA